MINPAHAHAVANARRTRAKTAVIAAPTLTQRAALLPPTPGTPPPPVDHERLPRLAQRAARRALRPPVRTPHPALLPHPPVSAAVRARLAALIATLRDQMVAVDAELAPAREQAAAWAAAAARRHPSTGVGRLTARWLWVTTVRGTRCPPPARATASAGRAPTERASGTRVSQRPRIGHTGHARVRTARYRATLSAAHDNPVIKPFDDRLRMADKPPKVARGAAARTLLQLAWARVTTEHDVDPRYAQRPHASARCACGGAYRPTAAVPTPVVRP